MEGFELMKLHFNEMQLIDRFASTTCLSPGLGTCDHKWLTIGLLLMEIEISALWLRSYVIANEDRRPFLHL